MVEQRYAPKRVTNALSRMLAEIPVDVEDRGDHYVVTADVPGSRTQDIEVTVNRDRVRIVTTPSEPTTRPDRGVRRRIVPLPEPVEEKRADAEYHQGVLRIEIPKRNPGGGRTIPVE
jgi:HSP20 family protein